MKEKERYEMLNHIRWIDEIQTNLSFYPNFEYLKKIGINQIFHGSDDSIGASTEKITSNETIKKEFEFIQIPRTKIISTTELIKRIFLNENNSKFQIKYKKEELIYLKNLRNKFKKRIIYVDGSFDIIHPRNVNLLKKAKLEGDLLIVGLHSDDNLFKKNGKYPIQTMLEREISLWGIKYVDLIILDAPLYPNDEYLKSKNIDLLAIEKMDKRNSYFKMNLKIPIKELETDFDYLTSDNIKRRVIENYNIYIKRFKDKDLIKI